MNVLGAFREGRAAAAIVRRLTEAGRAASATIWNPATVPITLVVPARQAPASDPIATRVLAAYARMKADQARHPAYLPSAAWAAQIATAFAPLQSPEAATFLANFGLSRDYTGIDSGYLIREAARSRLRRRRFIAGVLWPQLELWRLSTGAEWSAMAEPWIAGSCGIRIDGAFFSISAPTYDVVARQLAPLVADVPRPLIAELGGGVGRFCWTFRKQVPTSRYLGFDLPEVSAVGAYYVLHAQPNARVLLYGEGAWTDDHDVAFCAPWQVETMPPVDLLLNKNSLGEMSPAVVRRYLEAMVPRARWFWHMNHDAQRAPIGEGCSGLLAREYPVPARLISRYWEPGHALWLGTQSDIFVYLYTTQLAPLRVH